MNRTAAQIRASAMLLLARPGKMSCVSTRQRQMRILILCLIFVISSVARIAALDPASHITQYGHTVWRVQDGYFGGRALDIAQTTDGYVWVGTDAGLFRFDGVRFV